MTFIKAGKRRRLENMISKHETANVGTDVHSIRIRRNESSLIVALVRNYS